jgi:hypothetical protein
MKGEVPSSGASSLSLHQRGDLKKFDEDLFWQTARQRPARNFT